jgi:hypothetical protein
LENPAVQCLEKEQLPNVCGIHDAWFLLFWLANGKANLKITQSVSEQLASVHSIARAANKYD